MVQVDICTPFDLGMMPGDENIDFAADGRGITLHSVAQWGQESIQSVHLLAQYYSGRVIDSRELEVSACKLVSIAPERQGRPTSAGPP
jgi:hypothetical protein